MPEEGIDLYQENEELKVIREVKNYFWQLTWMEYFKLVVDVCGPLKTKIALSIHGAIPVALKATIYSIVSLTPNRNHPHCHLQMNKI